MKTKVFLISLILISNLCYTQIAPSKLGFGFYLNPALVNRTKHVTDEGESHRTNMMGYDKLRTGFSTGGSIHYRLSDNFSLGSGLCYTTRGYGISEHDLPVDSIIHLIPIFGSYPTESKGRYTYHFLDIPVSFEYNLKSSEKMNLYINGGISANLFFRESSYYLITFSDESAETNRDHMDFSEIRESIYHMLNLSWQVGIGAYYLITEQVSFQLEPNFNMTFLPVWGDPDVKPHLYRIGLQLGLRYSLYGNSIKGKVRTII